LFTTGCNLGQRSYRTDRSFIRHRLFYDRPTTQELISEMPRVRIPREIRPLVAASLGFKISGQAFVA
jgi:hypothetical protein